MNKEISFSRDVKEEATGSIPFKKCCRIIFLCIVLILRGKRIKEEARAALRAFSAKETRFFFKLLKEGLKLNTELHADVKKKEYFVKFDFNSTFLSALRKFSSLNSEAPRPPSRGLFGFFWRMGKSNPAYSRMDFYEKCCKKNILKAFFYCLGSINSPKKFYNLEWHLKSKPLLKILSNTLKYFDINFSTRKKNYKFILYIKRAEDISKVLNLIQAYKAQLYFEEARAIKETRDKIQRKVNCEIANLEKTTKASARQIFYIKYIKRKNKISNLPGGLKRLAEVRLRYPEASFRELGDLIKPKLSKPQVARRLGAVEKIARMFKEGKNGVKA